MSIPFDDEPHELKLGNSFDPHSKVGFHSIRYDFKPASVDTSKEACVEVGVGNQVTVTVPHIEGSGVPNTVFKGNKQPVMKECVLIIDHDKGTYTFEKISSKVTLKKTRLDGSSKAMQHISGRVTPVDTRKARPTTPTKAKKATKTSPQGEAPTHMPLDLLPVEPHKDGKEVAAVGEMSDSSSSSSSDDEMEDIMPPPVTSHSRVSRPTPSAPSVKSFGVLDNDLALSESGSDSDD